MKMLLIFTFYRNYIS